MSPKNTGSTSPETTTPRPMPLMTRLPVPEIALVALPVLRAIDVLSRQPIGRTRLADAPVPWVLRGVDATLVNPKDDRAERPPHEGCASPTVTRP